MAKEQFYTPYERQNHIDVEPIMWSSDYMMFVTNNLFVRDVIEPEQKVVRRYVINADYEYNPELIEVSK